MEIEQIASAAVAGLHLGDTFRFDDLIQAVQTRRRRRLRVVALAELDTSDGICAVWAAKESEDLILHAHTDSALHRQQFVLHEIAHMILGHCERDDFPTDDALLPDIPPYTRARLLKRHDLDSPDEIAAESLADRLAAGIRGSAFSDPRFVEVFG